MGEFSEKVALVLKSDDTMPISLISEAVASHSVDNLLRLPPEIRPY
jgi:hypothetical protein